MHYNTSLQHAESFRNYSSPETSSRFDGGWRYKQNPIHNLPVYKSYENVHLFSGINANNSIETAAGTGRFNKSDHSRQMGFQQNHKPGSSEFSAASRRIFNPERGTVVGRRDRRVGQNAVGTADQHKVPNRRVPTEPGYPQYFPYELPRNSSQTEEKVSAAERTGGPTRGFSSSSEQRSSIPSSAGSTDFCIPFSGRSKSRRSESVERPGWELFRERVRELSRDSERRRFESLVRAGTQRPASDTEKKFEPAELRNSSASREFEQKSVGRNGSEAAATDRRGCRPSRNESPHEDPADGGGAVNRIECAADREGPQQRNSARFLSALKTENSLCSVHRNNSLAFKPSNSHCQLANLPSQTVTKPNSSFTSNNNHFINTPANSSRAALGTFLQKWAVQVRSSRKSRERTKTIPIEQRENQMPPDPPTSFHNQSFLPPLTQNPQSGFDPLPDSAQKVLKQTGENTFLNVHLENKRETVKPEENLQESSNEDSAFEMFNLSSSSTLTNEATCDTEELFSNSLMRDSHEYSTLNFQKTSKNELQLPTSVEDPTLKAATSSPSTNLNSYQMQSEWILGSSGGRARNKIQDRSEANHVNCRQTDHQFALNSRLDENLFIPAQDHSIEFNSKQIPKARQFSTAAEQRNREGTANRSAERSGLSSTSTSLFQTDSTSLRLQGTPSSNETLDAQSPSQSALQRHTDRDRPAGENGNLRAKTNRISTATLPDPERLFRSAAVRHTGLESSQSSRVRPEESFKIMHHENIGIHATQV